MKKLYVLFLLSFSVLFSQNSNCLPPSNIQISNATTTSVVLNWQPGADETMWEVLVQPTGSPAPTANSQGIVASTSPFTLTGLTPGVAYDYCVRALCGQTTEVSDWV
ncbi:MAG: fibronectin type III domain-containing protein [Flavobacterium sp.]